jgi:hypothetical protein
MYIGSTNLPLDLPGYNNISTNWITSEKYYNCDNFYYHMNMIQKKKRKLKLKHK